MASTTHTHVATLSCRHTAPVPPTAPVGDRWPCEKCPPTKTGGVSARTIKTVRGLSGPATDANGVCRDRVDRVAAAGVEARTLKAWERLPRAARDPQAPATPNLDAINAEKAPAPTPDTVPTPAVAARKRGAKAASTPAVCVICDQAVADGDGESLGVDMVAHRACNSPDNAGGPGPDDAADNARWQAAASEARATTGLGPTGTPRTARTRHPNLVLHRNGKPNGKNTLSSIAFRATKGMGADGGRLGVDGLVAFLADQGITEPENTAWAITLPNGVAIAATITA